MSLPSMSLLTLIITALFLDSSDTMASPGQDNYRMKSYKNKALNPQEMRRRREEEGIQLRKQKREEQVNLEQLL